MWIPASFARWLLSLLALLAYHTGATMPPQSASASMDVLDSGFESTIDDRPAVGATINASNPGLVKLRPSTTAATSADRSTRPYAAQTDSRPSRKPLAAPVTFQKAVGKTERWLVAADIADSDRDDAILRPAKRSDRDGDGVADRIIVRRHRVTAYCDRGLTAAGVPSGVGQCAAPADIPLGSLCYIPELKRYFVVTDRTHQRFRHNTVDLFMPVEAKCDQFGVKRLTCEFIICPEPPRYGTLSVREKLAAAGG